MKKYFRNQGRVKDLKAIDNPFTRAAANLVSAIDSGNQPATDDLQMLAQGFKVAFGKCDPQDIFGPRIGLVIARGRPLNYGFTPSDIVSAVIALHMRKEGMNETEAKKRALQEFEDISGGDAYRQVSRDWSNSKETILALTTDDLELLIKPYEVVPAKT